MALGVVVTVVNSLDGSVRKGVFPRPPVRIGRNILNDLRLEVPYVSQFHATLEVQGDALVLHDLGSKNGIMLRDKSRLVANGTVDLAKYNHEFFIPPFSIRATIEDIGSTSKKDVSAHPATERLVKTVPDVPPEDDVPRLYEAYRTSWAKLHSALVRALTNVHPGHVDELGAHFVNSYPAIKHEPEFRNHYEPGAVDPIVESQRKMERAEYVALDGLRGLVRSYLPRHPALETAEQVQSFIGSIKSTLDVFFKCFIPLRDGQKQFQTQMNLDNSRSGSALLNLAAGVENARSDAELGNVLLDWRREDATHAQIEATFADLMIHQVALLNGVMAGIKSLLAELSPESIERAADDPRRARGGIQIGPFRFKQLWETYAEKHADFAEEERFAFEVIFGNRFAAAYRQYNGAATMPARAAATVPPPKE